MTYRVLIPARNLSGKQIGEILEVAISHKAEAGVNVLAGDPMLVVE